LTDVLTDPDHQPLREALLAKALLLVSLSVAFGAISGAVSVTAGVLDHSLGVLAAGLAVLADLMGSAVLIWRFRAERNDPARAAAVEDAARPVVAAALIVICVAQTFESTRALLAGSRPGDSLLTLAAAAVAVLVLAPLAYLKRSTAAALSSRALQGDTARLARSVPRQRFSRAWDCCSTVPSAGGGQTAPSRC
jgi:divalent metal cation (Fe/Co/Zn/Cd) transporter